jgi:hypothetical protein
MQLISPSLFQEPKSLLTHRPSLLDARKCTLKDQWILPIERVLCIIIQPALVSYKVRVAECLQPSSQWCSYLNHRLTVLILSNKLCPFSEVSHLNPSSWRVRHGKLGEIGCISALTFFFLEKGWTQDLRVGVRLKRPNHFILFFSMEIKTLLIPNKIKTKMLKRKIKPYNWVYASRENSFP